MPKYGNLAPKIETFDFFAITRSTLSIRFQRGLNRYQGIILSGDMTFSYICIYIEQLKFSLKNSFIFKNVITKVPQKRKPEDFFQ